MAKNEKKTRPDFNNVIFAKLITLKAIEPNLLSILVLHAIFIINAVKIGD